MSPNAREIIRFYKALEAADWTDTFHVFGSFCVNNTTKNFVAKFSDDLEIELENHAGDIIDQNDIDKYDNLQIRFFPTRSESFFFAKNFEDYLKNFHFIYKPAAEFYIADIDAECVNNQSKSEKVNSYLSLIELYSLLQQIADHTEVNQFSASLIYISSTSKEEIQVRYSSDELKAADRLELIKKIKEEIFSPPHSKTKISLFKKSILLFAQGVKANDRFVNIYLHLDEIEKRYSNNYDLFLNEFSFENEKEKLEEKKQSYLLKINEVLSGIHGKLFAVPASVIIVAGQMKSQTDNGYQLINLIILLGAFVFSLFMWMLTANQLHSLNALKSDFDSKKKRLENELRESLYTDLQTAFKLVNSRLKYQRRMIFLIDMLVILGFLFSFLVFEYQTQLIAEWLTTIALTKSNGI